MEKLPKVEAAKALMNEAVNWSVMKWLREKKSVRRAADQANAALDHLSSKIQESWPDEIRAAYHALAVAKQSPKGNGRSQGAGSPGKQSVPARIAQKLKEADDEAYRARMHAEETFDQAEKQLSTSLARRGCVEAIRSWELKEKAIEKSAKVADPVSPA